MATAVLLCLPILAFIGLLLAGLGWLYYRTRPSSVRVVARFARLLQLEVEIRSRE